MESSSPTTRDFVFESNGKKVCVEVSAEDTLAQVRKLILEERDSEMDSDVFPSGDDFAFEVNGVWILARQESKKNAFALLDKDAEVKLIPRSIKRKFSQKAESNNLTNSDGSHQAKRRKLNASTSVTPTIEAKTANENDTSSPSVHSRQNLASNFAKAQSSPALTGSKNGNAQNERQKSRNGTKDVIPSWTIDVFRPFVQRTLEEWKQDSLYTEIGLHATDTILKDDEKVPGHDDKSHPYNLFSNVIFKKIVDEFKLDNKQQRKKIMKITFRSFRVKWEAMIREKQKIQSPSKKKGDEIDDDLSPEQRQMKEEFEKIKQEVLDSLPEEVKSRFGEQFFSKWGNRMMPCLVLSPYRVPPGGRRDMWFDMYEKLKKQDRLAAASNLVYWYGSCGGPQNACSLVNSNKLITYAEGEKKNMHKVPNPMQKKLEAGKTLGVAGQKFVEGLAEMEEDRKKEPHERHGRMIQAFLEDWELPDGTGERKT